jgi:hypothetical protein
MLIWHVQQSIEVIKVFSMEYCIANCNYAIIF